MCPTSSSLVQINRVLLENPKFKIKMYYYPTQTYCYPRFIILVY